MAYKEPKEYTKSFEEYRLLPAAQRFPDRLMDWGLPVGEEQLRMLYEYYRRLYRGNSVMNLTAVIEDEEVLEKHFLDSLSLVKAVPELLEDKISHVIDIGTGAGFPGMPLAVFFPKVRFTLMDSLRKRTEFLRECAEGLGLSNIAVIQARAEDLARDPGHRERYDLAVSRAVADLKVLSEYALPFVRTGGTFVAYKSVKAEEELKGAEAAIAKLGGKAGESVSFDLSENAGGRTLVKIRKIRPTPKAYPRKAGTAERQPIQ